MQRDLKIGMVLGLVLAAAGAVWLATRPSLSTEARVQQEDANTTQQESPKLQSFIVEASPEKILVPAEQNEVTVVAAAKKLEPSKPQRIHTVQRGETLSGISSKYYGSTNKWHKIIEASQIQDANKIKPGTRLVIPE